jgi:RNA polymerase sigma factor (sigma-70 family)
MPTLRLENALRQFRQRLDPGAAALTDAQLLTRFVQVRDENAFAALVGRHGPLVLGVCRRVLSHHQDAEDALQATFLVLAQNARSIRQRESLRCWLHGVALRVARRLRNARRPEQALPPDLTRPTADALSWREAQAVIDEELQRLPERYRLPLVLCYLEGKTRDEAARELGWSLDTLRGRLDRGRAQLRLRLEGRGLAPSAALFGTLFTTPAALPEAVATATVRAALAAPAAVPAHVALLTAGMSRSPAPLRWVLLFLLLAGGVTAGVSLSPAPAPAPVAAAVAAEQEQPPAEEPVIQLGRRNLRFVMANDDLLEPGLLAISTPGGPEPFVRDLYRNATTGQVPAGCQELVGLWPGVHSIADRLEVVTFERRGRDIVAVVKDAQEPLGQHVNRVFYLRATLPPLPPGRYTVRIHHQPHGADAPNQKPTLTCTFNVPHDRAAAVHGQQAVKAGLPGDLERRIDQADRIVAVEATKKDGWVEAFRVFKGPLAKPLEGDWEVKSPRWDGDGDGRWILFLRAVDDGRAWPRLSPATPAGWAVPYSDELAERIAAAVPLPAQWSPGPVGLRVGLRVRRPNVRFGDEVVAEVVVQNAGDRDVWVPQQRYNIYDYWPALQFEVTAPGGRKWVLEKPVGKMTEADHPHSATLKPGQSYVHTVRLNLWPVRAAGKNDFPIAAANGFVDPGTYTVRCAWTFHDKAAIERPPVWSAPAQVEVLQDQLGANRLEVFRKHQHGFHLCLAISPRDDGRFDPNFELHCVDLFVGNVRFEPPAVGPNGKPVAAQVQVSADQAQKLLMALHRQGFFERARSHLAPPPALIGRGAGVDLSHSDTNPPLQLRATLAWDADLPRLLDALHAALGDGEAARVLDRLRGPVAAALRDR